MEIESEVICLSDEEDNVDLNTNFLQKQTVLIEIESDKSSDEEENSNLKGKKKTRRGLKLDDDDPQNYELEKELESSNIYTSKRDTFRKEAKNFHENISIFLSSIPSSPDSNSSNSKNDHNLISNSSESCTKRFCKRINSEIEIIENNIERNSPSPPPVQVTYSKKRNRKTNKILSEMEASKRVYHATRNLVMCQKSQEQECDLLETDYQRTLTVKFRWQGTILRIPMKMTQKFATVLPELAQKCEVCIADIFLIVKEEAIQAEDSPNSFNLTSADIIDCYVVKTTESNIVNDKSKITLQLQASDSRKKLTISINKLSPMSCLMEDYANQRNIPLEKLKFMFDGDLLKNTDTPFDLEMENDKQDFVNHFL